MAKKIEQKTAETITQRSMPVVIGDKEYFPAPPSIATLVLVSEAVSLLPHIKLNDTDVLAESLAVAKECKPIGDIMAILILGAKGLTEVIEREETLYKTYLWGLIKRPYKVIVKEEIDRKAQLSQELLENVMPSDLFAMSVKLLSSMQVQDFFALTTFLTEINLLRQTKVD